METWTDGLPVCYFSGVGFSTNQRYREDGYRQEEHPFEDRSFHFKLGENTYLYGVFDGHCTGRAADIAAQRIPAELALGQLQGATDSEKVKAILHQAIQQAEKDIFESFGDLLAERTSLQMELQQYGNQYAAVKSAPEKMHRLEDINSHICSGTSALVALVHNDLIYFANIGTSRALLCRLDTSGQLRVRRSTVDHSLDNESELARLASLGLSIEQLCRRNKLVGTQLYTRCLGDYSVKGGYRQFFESLSMARGEPVIAEPEIQGGIPLDSNTNTFLILMSDGVYTTLEHATRTQRANADIASMVASEFAQQSTLNGVAQAVIDRIVRMHHDAYMLAQPEDERKQTCQRHDDMTLLVRSFGYPLGHHVSGVGGGGGAVVTVTAPTSPPHSGSSSDLYSASAVGGVVRQTSRTAVTITPSLLTSLPDYTDVGQLGDYGGVGQTSDGVGVKSYDGVDDDDDGTLDGENSERSSSLGQITQSLGSLILDPDGRIESYVSFDEYFEAYDKWSDEEQRNFNEQCVLKVEHDSIPEVPEPASPEPGTR